MLSFFNVINGIFVAVTIIAYGTGYFLDPPIGSGLYFQFFLGIFLLLFALVLMLGNYKQFNDASIRMMGRYWLAVAAYVVLACLLKFSNGITVLIVIIFLPMLIACYQVYAFNKIIMDINSKPL
jgi:signal transduction histidine kinase